MTSRLGYEVLKEQFPDVGILHLPLLDAPGIISKSRRAMQLLTGRDLLLEWALRSCGISLLSHSGYLGKHSAIPSIAWIPDFQELSFPEFFSAAERASRRRNLLHTCRHASILLLSSEAALSDLRGAGAQDGVVTAVLPFVAAVPPPVKLMGKDDLRSKYGVGDKFFHLPNQFWIHKNHMLVIEAVALLREQGRSFEVIATGNTHDPRQPDYFASLLDAADKLGVKHLFKPFGVVPYQDLMSFMRHAVAVINPSRFEGWSTTVEEAKSMGKAILLSDIPVHREQAPDRATFFSPESPRDLAAAMAGAWDRWDADANARYVSEAMAKLHERQRDFALRYQGIVLSAMGQHQRL